MVKYINRTEDQFASDDEKAKYINLTNALRMNNLTNSSKAGTPI